MNMAWNKGITRCAKLEKLFGKEAYSISKDSLLIIRNMNKLLLMYVLGIKMKKKQQSWLEQLLHQMGESRSFMPSWFNWNVTLVSILHMHIRSEKKLFKKLIFVVIMNNI
jgi:hypothetical protein